MPLVERRDDLGGNGHEQDLARPVKTRPGPGHRGPARLGLAGRGAPDPGRRRHRPSPSTAPAPGRTFGGIGAISGGGGNSRLLTDYPAAQQQQILDYLFKPGYGADLQILKVEIGGDTNSTDGSESSIEHASGSINCSDGYEWWLMEQAKALNPNIKLYGLAWGAPGWIGGGSFWSTATINYLVSWLNCAASHDLTINYLGGWNERGYNISWYEQLRSTLNADGYSSVQIVGADSDWSIATDIAGNSTFASAVSIIGVHYPCAGGDGGSADTCPANSTAEGTGKPLWASENGSQDLNSGAPALIRSITRGYVDADLTAYINWPLIAAIYPNLPYNTDGLILANQPWSGAYSVGESLWATAQVTQFTAPGWQFLNSGSGYLGGSESNGSYVTLKSTDGTDYSTIIETTTATRRADRHRQRVRRPVHRHRARVVDRRERARVRGQHLRPAGQHHPVERRLLADRAARLHLHADHHHRPGQGHRGQPGAEHADAALLRQLRQRHRRPAARATCPRCRARSRSSRARAAGPGSASSSRPRVQPIEWDNNANPYTIGGNLSWANYTVSADALMSQAGAVQLLGRVGAQDAFEPGQHQRLLPAAQQHRRVVDRAQHHERRADHAGQRHGDRARHRHLAAPGADLQRQHRSRRPSTAPPSATVTDSVVRLGHGRAGHLAATRPTSSTTCRSPWSARPPRPGRSSRATTPPSASTSTAGPAPTAPRSRCGTATATPRRRPGPWPATAPCRSTAAAWTSPAPATANGTLIEEWTCNGGANQQWLAVNGELVNPVSGKCLDDPGFNTTEGTQLDLWTCNGGSNQQWSVP